MGKKILLILISYRSECCESCFFKMGKMIMGSQKAYILTYQVILISKMGYFDKFTWNCILYINDVAFYWLYNVGRINFLKNIFLLT